MLTKSWQPSFSSHFMFTKINHQRRHCLPCLLGGNFKKIKKKSKTINIQNRQLSMVLSCKSLCYRRKIYRTQITVNKYWTTKQPNKGQCTRKQEKLCTQETVPFVSQIQELLDTNLDLIWTWTKPTFIFNFHPQYLEQWGTNHTCIFTTN